MLLFSTKKHIAYSVYSNFIVSFSFLPLAKLQTLTPNSGSGTDHAWGGNYFVFGGDMKGGKILGHYPAGFTEADPTNLGRGRLVPTT